MFEALFTAMSQNSAMWASAGMKGGRVRERLRIHAGLPTQ